MNSDIEVNDFIRGAGVGANRFTYKTCCGASTDARLIILGLQFILSLLFFGFAATMIARSQASCETVPFQNILFTIISFWLGKISKG